MKQIYLISLFVLWSNYFYSQANYPWQVEISTHLVDIRKSYNLGGITEDYIKQLDANYYGIPLRFALSKQFSHHWGVETSLSFNKIKKDIDWSEGAVLKDESFYYIDAKALYFLNFSMYDYAAFNPYLGLGVGYSKTHLNDFKINGGWGFNLYLNDNWGINMESTYNHNFKGTFKKGDLYSGTGTDFFQHSLGVFLALGYDNDSDADGIKNKKDKCPKVYGELAYEGCPPPKTPENTDTDADGIVDAEDSCPNEVGTISNKGCPEKDTDADGVPDHIDDCPREKGTMTLKGCPEKVKEKAIEDEIIDARKKQYIEIKEKIEQIIIYFDFDSDAIEAEEREKLDKLVNLLKKIPELNVQVIGHTDKLGDPDYNVKLSERRVKKVINYFQQKGIDVSKLQIVPQGSRNLISNQNRLNRRVELRVIY